MERKIKIKVKNIGRIIKKMDSNCKIDTEKKQTDLIETVSKLVACLSDLDKNHLGLKGFRAVVKATLKSKRTKRRTLIESQERLFIQLFEKYREDILDESFAWLLKTVELFLEDTTECSLPLSSVYTKVSKADDQDSIIEIEALLCKCILLSLPPDHKDYKAMEHVCSQYNEVKAPQQQMSLENLLKGNPANKGKADKFIKTLINTVKGKVTSNGMNTDQLLDNVKPMVDDLTKDEEVKNMMEDVKKGDIGMMDIFASFLSNMNELETDKKV